MLSVEKQRTILGLLHTTDQSHREVARIAGVSRYLANRVMRCGVVIAPRQPKAREVTEYAEYGRKNPRARCPHCGVVVAMPCLACYLREFASETWLERTIRLRLDIEPEDET